MPSIEKAPCAIAHSRFMQSMPSSCPALLRHVLYALIYLAMPHLHLQIDIVELLTGVGVPPSHFTT